ncbi:MAG TPA: hypothetical protein PLP75_04155 [Burkholderiales bacterium]|nr:hypothetical protein [Burkholderiales bacterium]
MVNKRYEFYKWLSDTIKTLSWGASGMMAYFSLGAPSIHSTLAIIWYFGGLQILAFKLNLRALEEKEGE